MRRRTAICLAAVLAFAPTGCGTAINLVGQDRKGDSATPAPAAKEVYGGVSLDTHVAASWIAAPFVEEHPPNSALEMTLETVCKTSVGAWVLAVDLPLSVVGDTLTLPVTIPAALQKPNKPAEKKPSGVKDPD